MGEKAPGCNMHEALPVATYKHVPHWEPTQCLGPQHNPSKRQMDIDTGGREQRGCS